MIPGFNNFREKAFKTLLEKEKMLVTSILPVPTMFSHLSETNTSI